MSDLLRDLGGQGLLAAVADRDTDSIWSIVGSQAGGDPTDTSEWGDELIYGSCREDQARTP